MVGPLNNISVGPVTISIEVRDPMYAGAAQWIDEDFRQLLPIEGAAQTIGIVLGGTASSGLRLPLFWLPRVSVFAHKKRRIYHLKSGVKAEEEFAPIRRYIVTEGDADAVYEAVYLYLLSSIGEILESQGWFRLHAFSAVRGTNRAIAVVAGQQFGKSRLALQAISQDLSEIKVLGDEILLVRESLHPLGFEAVAFPSRLATYLGNFMENSISTEGLRQISGVKRSPKFVYPKALPNLVVSLESIFAVTGSADRWRRTRGLHVVATLFDIFLSRGVPQMVEYLFRWGYLRRLPGTLWRRGQLLRRLLRAGRIVFVRAGPVEISHIVTIASEVTRPLEARSSVEDRPR